MVKDFGILLSVLASLALGGCGRAAGVIFPPTSPQIVWPPDEEPARIRYVGQLATNQDLKPGRSSLSAVGQAMFGKPEIRAMLTPFAVCTDGANRVFVADSNAQLVHVFDLKSRKYRQWKPSKKQPQFAQPVGIAWDSARGRLLVTDSVAATILVFDGEGKYQGEYGRGTLKRPCGLAADPITGRIFVADSAAHQVVVFSSTGQETLRVGQRGTSPGTFNFPIDVAVDHQQRLYVVDALNFRVQQFSPDLKPSRMIGEKGDTPGSFAQPKSVDVDSDDHVYVVDNRFEAVQIFDAEGQLLLNFGQEGRGPGEFWLPAGIYIDPKDRIWIADSYNRRVQVFDYLGNASVSPVQESKQ